MAVKKVVGSEKVKAVEVKDWKGNGSYAEIYHGGHECQLALLGPNNEQLHGFAYCKDFMNDVFWAIENGKPGNIHGFRFDPAKDVMPDMKNVRALVTDRRLKREDADERALIVQECLNSAEEALGMSGRTVAYTVSNPQNAGQGYIVLVSPNDWRDFPALFSFHGMMIRSLFEDGRRGENIRDAITRMSKEMKTRDSQYMAPAKDFIFRLFDEGYKKVLKGREYKTVATVSANHHQSGIWCTATGKTSG